VYFVFIEELFKSQETPSHLQKAVGHLGAIVTRLVDDGSEYSPDEMMVGG